MSVLRAPEIHLEELLPEQPVANVSFEKFAGKTVVLEMWGTFLIDSHGRIAGSLDPTLLTAAIIEAVMNYKRATGC